MSPSVCGVAQPLGRAAPSFLFDLIEKSCEAILRCFVGMCNSLRRQWEMCFLLEGGQSLFQPRCAFLGLRVRVQNM